jgi:4-hydroxy-tetrahydrodipicolinate reductase
MGKTLCEAILADQSLNLVAVVDPQTEEIKNYDGVSKYGSINEIKDFNFEVAVDFTEKTAAMASAEVLSKNKVHAVIGTTGFSAEEMNRLKDLFKGGQLPNAVVVPNFAIGAVLLGVFCKIASRYMETAEIIELHHDQKKDSPSGTALMTADLMLKERVKQNLGDFNINEDNGPSRGMIAKGNIAIHSVRLKGLVAHQEVLFGTVGQSLSLRHDSIDRSSFMPGVILAIKKVPFINGLEDDMSKILGL